MNREIKFRWFDTYNKKMVDDCYYGGDSQGINELIKSFSRDLIPMQYTGLKDKNGKEIYEGDIVKPINGKPFEIKWGINITERDGSFVGFNDHSGSDFKLLEIIGNIYENPELAQK